jgi:hypothetical protein
MVFSQDGGIGNDAAGDAGTEADASQACEPIEPDGGVCNSLSLMGSPVHIMCEEGPTPRLQPSGGTVIDGTYALVSGRVFNTGCPFSLELRSVTWNVCGASWAVAGDEKQDDGPEAQYSLDFVVTRAGQTHLMSDPACGPPGGARQTLGFDAAGSSLTLYYYYDAAATMLYRVEEYVRL